MLAVPLQVGDRVIGLIYVDSSSQITDFTAEDLSLLTVMANVAAIRIEHARLAEVEEAEHALARDLEQAAEIQRQILPGAPPQVPGFDLAGYNSPCRAVGGDYYDFHLHEDGHVWLVLGDVAGKGMPAALMVASLQARLQVLFEETTSPAALVTRLNRLVAANCPSNRFITFFAGTLDPATGGFTYCNAGHNPPLVMRSSGTVERLTDGGLILGILPQAVYQESACTLAPGDALVLFSDGVTEATGAAGEEEFGEERLAALIRDGMAGPACEMVAAVTAAVAQWGGAAPAADDITLVVARRILPLPPE
jgi:sigma-B regulation protein RsbU (phosphoserine phosphatase)